MIRRPFRAEISEDLIAVLDELTQRLAALGHRPEDAIEHALYFGVGSLRELVAREESAARALRDACQLTAPAHA